MQDRTITIVIDNINYPVISEITQLLADANINLDEMDAEALETRGIIHIKVEAKKQDIAINILKEAHYFILANDCEIFEIEDKPGSLARLTATFKEANRSIKSIRFIHRSRGKAKVSISFM